jgi:hypothetical protein
MTTLLRLVRGEIRKVITTKLPLDVPEVPDFLEADRWPPVGTCGPADCRPT